MEKTDARKLKKEVQQQLRQQAIRLRKKGMGYRDIAEIVGVNPDTVGRWCREYAKHLTFHTHFCDIYMNFHSFYGEMKVFGSTLRALRYSS
jgi:DNA invertase Pin-like site-specific DNA recombinase